MLSKCITTSAPHTISNESPSNYTSIDNGRKSKEIYTDCRQEERRCETGHTLQWERGGTRLSIHHSYRYHPPNTCHAGTRSINSMSPEEHTVKRRPWRETKAAGRKRRDARQDTICSGKEMEPSKTRRSPYRTTVSPPLIIRTTYHSNPRRSTVLRSSECTFRAVIADSILTDGHMTDPFTDQLTIV